MSNFSISLLGGIAMVALLGVQMSMYAAGAVCLAFVLGLLWLAAKDRLVPVFVLLAWFAVLCVIWSA